MITAIRGTRASDHLNMVRGLAAMMVVLFHVRYRFFLDYADVTTPDVLSLFWYTATAFGHDAVMVFFVVSGFLVGSTALRDMDEGRWRWSDYLTARCVRLYVVLIPGLLLGLTWDTLGTHWFAGHAIYTGQPQSFIHDFSNVPAKLGWWPLTANALFLQGISAPQLGSNEALWSLAFEFWYYVAFPLFAIGCLGRTTLARRAGAVTIGAGILYMVGGNIALYFPIWLMGVAVGTLPSSVVVSRRPLPWAVATGAGFVTWLGGSHTTVLKEALGPSLLLVDIGTGLLFAVWLYTLLHDRRDVSSAMYGSLARWLAGISYTLYVVHLPLLVFLRAWLLPDRPLAVTPVTIIVAGCLSLVALVYAFIVAYATEYRTHTVRRIVDRWRGRQPAGDERPAGVELSVLATQTRTASR